MNINFTLRTLAKQAQLRDNKIIFKQKLQKLLKKLKKLTLLQNINN